ncbi:MAG: hypothetical protein FWD92_00690 [Methanomassiliicoccaceae archaeon]|nr:hypothetical protein [Methanomassiliicoccaceae archaeon]
MTLLRDIRTDFSLENGTLLGAMLSLIIAISMFIVLPYTVALYASGGLEQIAIGNAGAMEYGMWDTVSDLMKYAVPLILLSIPVGFYRSGSYAKIPFRILFTFYLGAWIWIASQGGIFTVEMGSVADGISSMTLNLDVRYIVFIVMIICLAMMFLAFAEFGGSREKYLKALEKKKDTMSKRKVRRVSGNR